MSEMPGSITVYDPSMAADVTAMFNDFNTLWPGGFGGGVPYTEQRVHDWLDATSAVADLIALDADGVPVGYCGLYPHWRDRHACYITILGVVPRAKGRKFGRRLLLHAVDLAIERGFTRLDLGTWPGNLDAVPLYKKTGLFWVPETSVMMQNYLPGLARSPLGRAWFTVHPDWYACFERALTQAPDQETSAGMEVYTYHFREGEDILVAKIDRYGLGLCSIDSTLTGKRLAVGVRVASHAVLMGIPNALTVEVTNGTGVDLDVALMVEPFAGLSWDELFPPTLTVCDGETATLTRGFTVDASAKQYEAFEASAAITVRAVVGGDVIELLAGGKIRPAAALEYAGGTCSVPSGGRDEVVLDLVNHAGTPLSGVVETYVEGVADATVTVPFALGEGETSGVAVPIGLPAGMAATVVRAKAFLERDGDRCAMPTVSLPVVSDDDGVAVVVEENGGDVLHLMTDLVDVRVSLKGGDPSMGPRAIPGMRRPAYFQIGPPFGITPDNSLRYAYRVARDGAALTLTLSADSRQAPGLRIDRHIRVSPGVGEIEHWVTLTATKPGCTRAGGRFGAGGYGGNLSLNPFGEAAQFFTPVAGTSSSEGDDADALRIIACDAQLSLLTESVVPQAPECWPETWTAVKGRARGDLAAWFWRSEDVAKVKVSHGMLSTLESESRDLAAGESMEVAHVWFGFGYTSLTEIRRRWVQLVGNRPLSYRDLRGTPEPVPPVTARWAGDSFVPAGAIVRKEIVFDLPLPVELDGDLALEVPDGWVGSLNLAKVSRAVLGLEPPQGSEPLGIDLTVPADAAGSAAAVRLQLRGEYEMAFDLPVLVGPVEAEAGAVDVTERTLEGRPVCSVASTGLRFDVMADAGGNLIRLQDAQAREFLHDVFPACVPRFFLTYYTGGAQPLAVTPSSSQFVYPPERVTARIVTEGRWRGVDVAWTIREQEELRGQQLALTYLVTPGLDVVRIRSVHSNPTPRKLWCLRGLMAFLDPSFCGEDSAIAVPGATQTWVRHPAQRGFVGPDDLRAPWAWFTAGDRSLGFLGLSRGLTAPTAYAFGDFAGVILQAEDEIQPGSSAQPSRSVAEFALVLNRPQDEAGAWLAALQALADIAFV